MTLRDLIVSSGYYIRFLDYDLTVSQLLDFEIEVFDGLEEKKVVGCSCYDYEDCSGEVTTKLQLFL